MTTVFSKLFLSLLLALGLSAPGTPVDSGDSPDLAAAVEEQAGRFDPNGFTSPPNSEGTGDADTSSSTLSPSEPKTGVDPSGSI